MTRDVWFNYYGQDGPDKPIKGLIRRDSMVIPRHVQDKLEQLHRETRYLVQVLFWIPWRQEPVLLYVGAN